MKPPLFRSRTVRVAIGLAMACRVAVFESFAVLPPPPAFDPDGGSAVAPLKVTIRFGVPEAALHITLDGKEPTPRDTEIEPGSQIVIDQPLTLKAKAWLPDGSVSATKTATYALKPVAGNGASFVDQRVPEIMVAGRTQRLTFTLRNIGTIPWTAGVHALAAYRVRDVSLWQPGPVSPVENTPTWGTATFTVQVTAPAAPGTYNLRWQMQGRGQAFGEATPVVRVAVVTAEEYERETNAQSERNPALTAKGPSRDPARHAAVLPKSLVAALASAKEKSEPAMADELDHLVRELQRSARSFRYLRTIGFRRSDEEFARFTEAYPALFKSVRIVRRDEQGQRVIPGWPGASLVAGR